MSRPAYDEVLDALGRAAARYRHAIENKTCDVDCVVREAWRLYNAHGQPLGPEPRCMAVWLAFEQWTTRN